MKNTILTLLLGMILGFNSYAQSEDQNDIGDQFSLEGALSIFENSESIEDFEKRLNEDNYSNNLDLNEDGEVEYLRVEDRTDGDVHAIVIQAIVDQDEAQDIAVIEIEKNGDESALLQIVGDEDLFGELKIVEPYETEAKSNSKGGPDGGYATFRVVVNVYFWSPVRHIYRPNYRPWVSPFRWKVYPKVYRPWKVRSWNTVHKHRRSHHHNYHVVRNHRVVKAHKVYTPHKRTSVKVRKTKVVKTNNHGKKKVVKTKSKTVVKSKNGKKVKKTNKVKVKKKKK